MKILGLPALIACVFVIASLTRSHAQQPRLRLEAAAKQSSFHIGERIPLTLTFSASAADRYKITSNSGGRDCTGGYDTFLVAPDSGWADPFAKYYSGGCSGSFLSSTGVLSPEPTIVRHDLNEWVRFDRPGTYKLVVTSRSVQEPASHTGQLTLRSNSIELRIVSATPEWQRAKLNAIVQQLHPLPAKPRIPLPGRAEAIADLRCLGTQAAIQELAADLREDEPDIAEQAFLGLVGVTDAMRAAAVNAMEKQIESSSFPVGGRFLYALSYLKGPPDTDSSDLQEQWERRNSEAWRDVYAGLPSKVGKARAATVRTLLDNKPSGLTAEQTRQLSAGLASSFLSLSQEEQVGELRYSWDRISADLPSAALESLARLPLKNPGSNESTVYTTRELKAAALQRWYERDPENARREALRQIGSSSPSLTAGALWFLPKQALPEFESTWAQALLNTDDYQEQHVLASLLTRFGSGAAAAAIAGKLQAKVGEWPCAPQAAALGYLVKFDPEAARPLIKRAIDARGEGKTACNHTLFQDVAAYAWGSVLSEAAVQTLDDPDRQVTMDALIYLAGYGTPEAEQPVRDRYRKWSETWAGKGDVLEQHKVGGQSENQEELGLGENLANALIAGHGWLADPALISAVLQGCMGEQMCTALKQTAAAAGPPYRVMVSRQGERQNYQVAQYTEKSIELLEEKLRQYPRGTNFVLVSNLPTTEDQKTLEREAAAVFAKCGMKLEPAP